MRNQGPILWFTGLSGAGKSTLAEAVASNLRNAGLRVEILDGDEVRTNLSKGLGFSKEDRDTNIRRIGYVARLLARNGVVAITAAISPYRNIRDEIRAAAEADGIPFVEIYLNCPLQKLAERDVKGLYKRALAGEIKNFTGIDDPYESPFKPEITLETDRESIEQSLDKIIDRLTEILEFESDALATVAD